MNLTISQEKPMNQSEMINELATALAKCQGELTPALKDAENPYFKSKYADLNSVWSVCREPLSKNGLSVIQTTDKDQSGALILLTTLMHSSGQWMRSVTPIPLLKPDPQAMGSAITYCRRYALSAIVGVSTDLDDDGEAAMPKDRNGKAPKAESPLIGKDEIRQLNEMSELCDPEYMAKVFNYLESQNFKGWDKLRMDMYQKVLDGMKKNSVIYQKGKENV